MKVKVLVAQSCPTTGDPMDCRLRLLCPWNSPGKSTGVGSMPFSRWFSQPRDQTRSPALQADCLLSEPPGKSKGSVIIIVVNTTISSYQFVKVKVTQLCPTLWDPMDSIVHGLLQARILDWVAFPFSKGSSQPRDQTQVSSIAGRFFTSWATRETQ